MPQHPGAGFPIPPFQWPHVGRQWPLYNVESDQAEALEAWWPTLASHDGASVLQDFSGHGHHAEIEANAAWLNTPQLGLALDTSGDGAAIVPEGNTLDPPQGSITLSIWVYYATSEPSRHIIAKSDAWGASTQRWFLKFQYANVQWGSTLETITCGTADVGALTLYTLTDDGTNTRLYKNGLLVDTDGSLTFDNDTGSKVALGKAAQTGTYLDGWLADPRIYRRVLSPAEVYQLYDPLTRWELYKPLLRQWQASISGAAPVTIQVGTLNLVGTAQTMTQVSGAASLAMDTLNLASTAQSLTQISGAVSLAMDALGFTGNAQALSISVSAVSLTMDVLSLLSGAQGLTVSPGSVSLAMDTLDLSAATQTLTVSAALIIAMNALGLTGAARSLTVTPGAVDLLMDTLGLAGDAQTLSISPGAVALVMDALNLSVTAETLTQVSGAVNLAMDTLNLSGTAPSLTVSTGIRIALALLALAGDAQSLAVAPGEVTIALNELQITAAALALTIILAGKLDVTLTDAAVTVLALSDAVVTALIVDDTAITSLVLDDVTRA